MNVQRFGLDEMDSLDIRIMRELFRGERQVLFVDQRKSLRDIAAVLGVDKETVRMRIQKLRTTGFLKGWVAFANPNLLGVKQTAILFDGLSVSSKDDLIRKIRLIPNVLLIANFYGSSVLTILFHDSDQSLKNAVELISRISGTERLYRFQNAFPECRVSLSKTDWMIMKCLQSNPLKSNILVSKELGLSSRTVKRRLDRLIEGKALIVVPNYDFNAIDSTVANLLVMHANPEQRREIDEEILSRLGDYMFTADLNQKTHSKFMLFVSNLSKAKEISAWMSELPGVINFRLDLFQERVEMWESYHELLERKLVQIPVRA